MTRTSAQHVAGRTLTARGLHVLQQPKSAWTWEIELRPWVERF